VSRGSPESLPTCPQCGCPIRLAIRVGLRTYVRPCGHYIDPDALRPAHADELEIDGDTNPLFRMRGGDDRATIASLFTLNLTRPPAVGLPFYGHVRR